MHRGEKVNERFGWRNLSPNNPKTVSAKSKLETPATAAKALLRKAKHRPVLGIVLGSGFGGVGSRVELVRRIPYAEIPGFPAAAVQGHTGELLLGKLAGVPVAVLSGRCHFYEGHSMENVTFAVRTLAALGVTDLLLTNAAGGINRRFRPGDLMALTDHINLMGVNPLRGPQSDGLPRFVDMTRAYDAGLRDTLKRAAKARRISLKEGVYLAVSGPSYETPAEIRAFATLGADAVGMSTVPEAIAAVQCGLRVAGISCITNVAAGLGSKGLDHAEVLETGDSVREKAADLLETFASLYARER